ncbi:hypothetical protein BV25DRAFT_1915481 [Artomyces pyxidatus]|uniref:Uncharacterized protein n=1 Tax=Artomyces pyxidatus TaxID=48021 RepID=A0ACB8T3V9_9AGAM|nr:hypothetical protein BV25DRAFT_1915481 [Artomyces pyxidatus]
MAVLTNLSQVFVNSQKFACESCIKGHRSSSCAHTDRPLYEIKKKGRPVSQCERCRQLRNTKRVHSKCTCSDGAPRTRETEKAFGTKQKRYIPIVPALPNGIKDAFPSSNSLTPVQPSDSRQKVDSLLNPCRCGDVWNCRCGPSTSGISPAASIDDTDDDPLPSLADGLETLARAAAIFRDQDTTPSQPNAPPSNNTATRPQKHRRKSSPASFPRINKRMKPVPATTPGPALPPLLFPTLHSPTQFEPQPSPPAFPDFMPPFSTLTSLAGSGCTCGLRCACPDCLEHRPGEQDKDCGESCQNCVDETVREVDLSTVGFRMMKSTAHLHAHAGEGSSSGLDHFFAQAARIPAPPVVGGAPVDLPKLCCGGSCGCGRTCACGGACNGCCVDGEGEAESEEPGVQTTEETVEKAGCCC